MIEDILAEISIRITRVEDDVRAIRDKVESVSKRVDEMSNEIWRIDRKEQNIEGWVNNIDKEAEQSIASLREWIEQLEGEIQNIRKDMSEMTERVDCMGNDVEMLRDNLIESEDTYNPPDDYIF